MAITYRDITLKNTEKLDKKQDKRNAFRAVITDNLGNQSGSGSIWADQNARRIWVMPIGGVQPFQIICVKITPVIGLGVICGYSDDFSTLLEVLRTDYEFLGPSNTTGTAYESPSNLDFLPGGRLQLWIDGRMIQPLATYPDTTGLLVNVVNGEYIYGGVRVTFDGEEGIDLTSSIPGTVNQHRYVGLYLDSANTIQTVDGTAVSTANTAPEPAWPAGAFELSMVLLANGQTDIDMTDIANKRIFSTDITSFAAGGWPFSQVLTVSTTDTDADYDNLPDAITGASAGDTILLDSETFTISGSALSVSKVLTIAGQSQAQTIITSALSNSPSIDVAADNVTFKNLTIAHTGAGTTAGPLSTDNANLVLDNVYLDKTSGAATTSYGLWMYGGSVTLKNGTRISTTAGTTKYGIYNDSADATITIFGGQIGGDTQDIYSARAGSTLNLNGDPLITNNLISWAGTIKYPLDNPNFWFKPTDHFNVFSGWTWASYGIWDGAPAVVDTTTFPGLLRLRNDSTAEDHFAYKAISGSTSQIICKLSVGIDSYVGIRLDDGTDNNFFEVRLFTSPTVGGMMAIQERIQTGGGGITTNTCQNPMPPGFYVLKILRDTSGTWGVYGFMTKDTPAPFYNGGGASGLTWTPANGGIIFGQRTVADNDDRIGLFDWYQVIQ